MGLELLPVSITRYTQGGLTLAQQHTRLDIRAKFFSQRVQVASSWNALSPEVRNVHSIVKFNYKLNEDWDRRNGQQPGLYQ